jgi:hypothetical protein
MKYNPIKYNKKLSYLEIDWYFKVTVLFLNVKIGKNNFKNNPTLHHLPHFYHSYIENDSIFDAKTN